MKKLMKKFETMMVAAAFAEEGEHETAREIMKEEKRLEQRERATKVKKPRKQMRA